MDSEMAGMSGTTVVKDDDTYSSIEEIYSSIWSLDGSDIVVRENNTSLEDVEDAGDVEHAVK